MPGVESTMVSSLYLNVMERRRRLQPSPSSDWDAIVVGDHDGTWFHLLEGVGTGAARRPSGEVVSRPAPVQVPVDLE